MIKIYWKGKEIIVNFTFTSGRKGTMSCSFPQSLIIMLLIRWLNNFEDFYWIETGWFINLSDQTFQPLIVIYRSGSFVYHNLGFEWVSYPFRSLQLHTYFSYRVAAILRECFICIGCIKIKMHKCHL